MIVAGHVNYVYVTRKKSSLLITLQVAPVSNWHSTSHHTRLPVRGLSYSKIDFADASLIARNCVEATSLVSTYELFYKGPVHIL